MTAKHGQAPIDRGTLRRIGHQVGNVLGPLAAQVTDDDVALVWLKDQSKTTDAVNLLATNAMTIGISSTSQILYGPRLASQFGDPTDRSNATSFARTPDIIVTPNPGVIYTADGPTKKIAEHGGFSHDDTNVALLVANPALAAAGTADASRVTTYQVAPTILATLGLDPNSLQAVQREGTTALPGSLVYIPGGPSGATPELGSGELLATGLLPLAAVLLYRRRRVRGAAKRAATPAPEA